MARTLIKSATIVTIDDRLGDLTETDLPGDGRLLVKDLDDKKQQLARSGKRLVGAIEQQGRAA